MTEETLTGTGPPKSKIVSDNVRAELARAGITHAYAAKAAGLTYPKFRRRLDPDGPDWRAGELEALARVLRVPLARLTEEPKP